LHGFVRADEESHEVWAFPGDEDVLLPHLDRYIITEDVALKSASAETAAFAVLGEPADSSIDGALMVRTVWDGIPVTLIAAAAADAGRVWDQLLSQGCQPAGMAAFHHLRIRERFPLIGQDLDRGHLAPEADRNDKAISYAKGCYLGQEPIARLDAMGHVNRALRTLRIDVPAEEIAGASLMAESNAELGQITSAAAAATPDQSIALAVLKLRNVDLTAPLSVVKDGGQLGHAEVV
jgi:folate-binding protein YgfZ